MLLAHQRRGTKMKVQLVQYDYQSDGQRAAQLAEKLITDDKVDVLFSPFGSATPRSSPHRGRYEIPIIACARRLNPFSIRTRAICLARCRPTRACSARW